MKNRQFLYVTCKHFNLLQGDLVYETTGRFDSASSFFTIDRNNGTVYTIRDMSLDSLYGQTYEVCQKLRFAFPVSVYLNIW